MIKVSIIIPVYNVAPWLGECLDSVLRQDYEDLQIICINDGSTDDSLLILQSFAEKDPRIEIIDQKNHGLGHARNRGLAAARGKYILFLDSDDYFTDGIITKLVLRAEAESLEILRFCSDFFYMNEKLQYRIKGFRQKNDYPGIFSGREFYTALTEKDEYSVVVWRSLYLHKFLEDKRIRFYEPENHRTLPIEDELFTFHCYLMADRVGFSREIGVIHRYRDNSIMTSAPSINIIRGYYLSAILMEQLLYENEVLVENYPLFFERPEIEMKFALQIYQNDFITIQAQAKTCFDRIMLKNLDRYIAANSKTELENIYQSASWRVGNFLIQPLHFLKKIIKG